MTTARAPESTEPFDPFARDAARQSLGEPQLLLREATTASLATLEVDDAFPYASLVAVATLGDGTPVLLLSGLARHTRNLAADSKGSLLVAGAPDGADLLTAPRLTVVGRFRPASRPEARARYLARHPSAEGYADFADFAFYEMDIAYAHLVAGFGRIRMLSSGELLAAAPSALAADDEREIVRHMNDDHRDAVLAFTRASGLTGDDPRLTGVDTFGCDVVAGGRGVRLPFATPLAAAADARMAFKLLVDAARAKP